MLQPFHLKSCAVNLFGSAFLAFGLYHVHNFAPVTEGGQLGIILLLQHWFTVSPALSGLIINILCYSAGWKSFGKTFLAHSAVAALGFSGFYFLFEQFPPLWPNLYQFPLLAAIVGAIFVGIGSGLCVRVGGAPNGDDAVVMLISDRLHIKIEYVYLFFDFTVLALSLTYIPLNRILYSVLSVTLSSFLVGFVQRAGRKEVGTS